MAYDDVIKMLESYKKLESFNILLNEIIVNDNIKRIQYNDYFKSCAYNPESMKIRNHINKLMSERAERYKKDIAGNKKQMLIIINMIENVPDKTAAQILKLKYIEGLTFEQIEEKTFYSHDSVYRKRKKAVAYIAEHFKI